MHSPLQLLSDITPSKEEKPDVSSSESVLNTGSTVHLNQTFWHSLLYYTQTCGRHEAVLQRSAKKGQEWENTIWVIWYLKGTKHRKMGIFRGDAVEDENCFQQPRRQKFHIPHECTSSWSGENHPAMRAAPQYLTSLLSSSICKTKQTTVPEPQGWCED